MANDKICVFCGEKVGLLGSSDMPCAGTFQPCCRICGREVTGLPEEEQCRRALKLGLARDPEKLEERIQFIESARSARPACLRCGGKLKYQTVKAMHNTDSVLNIGFPVLPAFCEKCGKYEFFEPTTVRADARLAWLIRHDTGE
jgi:hypothetical protein